MQGSARLSLSSADVIEFVRFNIGDWTHLCSRAPVLRTRAADCHTVFVKLSLKL